MINYSKFFKAIGDPSRQKIMKVLRKRGELKVGDIVKPIKLAQPTVSQHLKVLADAGVVKVRKQGQESYYALCNSTIYDVIAEFMKHYRINH
jgi:DNA-binding transcriptional ArsR family regulator